MTVEGYARRSIELEGWPVRIASYRIGGTWHAKADNVSPGANIAKATASTREGAERVVIEKSRRRLARTRKLS